MFDVIASANSPQDSFGMLLLLKLSTLSDEICCRASLATLIVPSPRLLSLRYKFSNPVLCNITHTNASLASSVI